MCWKKVKEIVGKSAPVLGTLLGGPAGATVGALVASVLGVDASPAEVERALKVDPQAAIKLKELETTRQVELQRLVVAQAEAELKAETE